MTGVIDCPAQNWTGYLLAGGKSKRMGVDKRHLLSHSFEGQSLMEHVATFMASLCRQRRILVAATDEADLPDGFLPVADRTPGQGPLPAISDALQDLETPFALILPVDMPCLDQASVAAWMSSFEDHPQALAQHACDAQQHPTFPVLIRQEFCASLAAELDSGQVRLFQGLRAAGAVGIAPKWQPADGSAPDPFLNLNRPADLEQLESDKNSSHP